MSSAIRDLVTYNNQHYFLLTYTNKLDFNYNDYNFEPTKFLLCPKGYNCSYIIDNNQLNLLNLTINSKNKQYPIINNVFAQASSPDGPRTYTNLNLKLNYYGKIIIGRNPIRTYSYLFIAPIFAYEELIEFEIENDNIINIKDCSSLAQVVRNEIKEYALSHKEELYTKPSRSYILPEFDTPIVLDEEYYIQEFLKRITLCMELEKRYKDNNPSDYWWL